MRVFIDGIGILGPGLNGWPSSQPILTGDQHLDETDASPPTPNILPANERRRSSETVKLALHVAQEAIDHSQVKPQEVATVFASSEGEGAILHQLCSTLTTPIPQFSPTLFHHSVHNAPAGYWAIAHHSQLPSTSISCHDGTFSGALLETTLQAIVERIPTALVAYDVPAPPPLYKARPILAPFGIALLVRHEQSSKSLASLGISFLFNRPEEITICKNSILEKYRKQVPAARGLPLLSAIANLRPAAVVLEYLDNIQVKIDIIPCP
jgi:hypothetical protein